MYLYGLEQGEMNLKIIKSTNGYEIKVDEDNYNYLIKYNWSVTGGYAVTSIDSESVAMHRMLLNAPSNMQVDHVNRNTLDNRIENLRICTKSENMKNRGKVNNKSSKYKGVSLEKKTNNWVAEIKSDNERFYLGIFDDEISAANCYNYYAKLYHGDFACLNEVKFMEKEEWMKHKQLTKSSSNFIGLSWKEETKGWFVSVWNKTKKSKDYIGIYSNELAGANAYNYFFRKINGKYGKVNYIDKNDVMCYEEFQQYKNTLDNRSERGWKKK